MTWLVQVKEFVREIDITISSLASVSLDLSPYNHLIYRKTADFGKDLAYFGL